MILDGVVFKVHFVLRGRDKPWNILPGSNGPFFPKHLRRTFDVSIYIVTHPNKHLGIKLYNRIPNGLRIQQTQRDRVLFINLPKSQIKLNEIRFITRQLDVCSQVKCKPEEPFGQHMNQRQYERRELHGQLSWNHYHRRMQIAILSALPI